MHFTKRTIEAIKPPAKGYAIHWDDKTTGLGVRVTFGGAKSFIYQRRIAGRTRRMTIGPFPSLGVEAARQRAAILAGEVAGGKDPVIERQHRAAANITLGAVLAEYLTARDLKPRTRRDIEEAMRGLSDWMNRPIRKLTPAMIAKRHQTLGEHSAARANLAMRYLRSVLNYASAKHADDNGTPFLAYNPVKHLSATKAWYRVERRRVRIEEHQLRPWWRAVSALGDDPALRHGPEYRDYLITVLLTGLRRSEALNLKWESVDLTARTFTIADTKNREPHTLPLPPYLLALFKARRERSTGAYVFSGADGQRIDNFRTALERVRHTSGVAFAPHDLRRTFATVAERLDISSYAVKRLLNHKMSGDVTAGYIVFDVERLREPMEKIETFTLKAAGVKGAAAVLPHRAARQP